MGIQAHPEAKTYYQITVIKTAVLLKDKQIDQWNKIESSETDQHILGNSIYGKADIADDWDEWF